MSSVIKMKLTLNPGSNAVTSASLFNGDILGVWREGLLYTRISQLVGFSGAAEWKFTPKHGRILFNQVGSTGGERVWVLYKQ